jgi:hypothetical protein
LRAFFKRLLLLSSSGEPCSVCIGEFDIAGLLGMLGEADQGDAVKRVVRRPIATARQPMAHSLARRRRHWSGPAQRGEGGFSSQPLRVVSGCHQELRGGVGPTP